MTEELRQLVHDYGLLSVTITTMDKARQEWFNMRGPVMSEEELSKKPIAPDEPIMIVRVSEEEKPSFLNPDEHDLIITDTQSGDHVGKVSVLELPEDEFYFFKAFREGISNLSQDLPDFLFGMCLIHAYGLLEHYFTNLLKQVFIKRPEMLGRSKTINYGEFFDTYPAMDRLLENMVEREIREIFYKSFREILDIFRQKYGFKQLTTELDDKIVELSLIRNCVVHNRSLVDVKLENESGGRYKRGTPLILNERLVFQAINDFRKLALEVDKIAEAQHLKI